jgi:hypothetical protein
MEGVPQQIKMTQYQIKMTHKRKMAFWIFSLIWFKLTDLDQIGEFVHSYHIWFQIFGATVVSAN